LNVTGLRVLLVEDDSTDRTMVEQFIARGNLPYWLAVAESVNEAIALLDAREFDIILTEYQLKDGSGIDVLRCAGLTPCIVITRVAARSVVINVMKEGAYDFVVKDSGWEYVRTLPAAIDEALERRRLRAQLGCWRKSAYEISGQDAQSYPISGSSWGIRPSSEPSYSSETI
jgi:DNA-binding NtrC family response regulator